MKNKSIRPVGLKGDERLNRMKELMGVSNINEDTKGSVVELTKMGPDGKIYGIVRENHDYFIKTAENKEGLINEDFNYIGGLQNKKSKAYPSYAKAIKQLNLMFMSLNEAAGKSGQVNVFEDDSLLTEHHPLKADQALSATKGMGDGQEYIVNKKGENLDYDNKEGKEDGEFGDNVADKKVDSEFEEVKLNETEEAIDEMIEGEAIEEVVEEVKGYSISKAVNEMDNIIESLSDTDVKVDEILESLSETEKKALFESLKKKD
jgi:hypothetical protein